MDVDGASASAESIVFVFEDDEFLEGGGSGSGTGGDLLQRALAETSTHSKDLLLLDELVSVADEAEKSGQRLLPLQQQQQFTPLQQQQQQQPKFRPIAPKIQGT